MKKLVFLLGIISIINACIFIRMDDSIDLGNNYRYIKDYPQSIIYYRTTEYEGVGVNIIPPVILSYNYNDRYIIAISYNIDKIEKGVNEKQIQYWLVDKTTNGEPVFPMDSNSFYRQLQSLNVKLNFK